MPFSGDRIRRADVLFAGAVVVLAVVEGLSLHHHRLVGTALFGVTAASLAARRRWPAVPVVSTGVLMVILVAAGFSLNAGVSLVIVVVVAAYSAAAYLALREAITMLVVLLAGGTASVLLDSRPVPSNLAFMAVLAGVPWGAGVASRLRQRYIGMLEERSKLLEREREASAEAAVAEERARIARELHDIVSHSLSVISLQAGGVRRLLAPEQEKERRALMAVEHTARNAVEEMHHMLGLLRAEGGTDERNPQPGLAQLPDLIDHSAAAGLPVALTVEGRERPLSSGVELAAYRIIQEALTNVTKHSDASEADVRLCYDDRALRVSIVDRGKPTHTGHGAGMGLRGMRERVAVYHGTLTAGPVPGGGYRVDAALPYPMEPA